MLIVLPGCSRVLRAVVGKQHQSTASASLDDLRSDVERPADATDLLCAHWAPLDPKDEQLAAFTHGYCHDLALRLKALPAIRGQVPPWVAEQAAEQLGLPGPWKPQEAVQVARLSGMRQTMGGTIERRGDRLRAVVGVYDTKTGEPIGDLIEVTGTPQEFMERAGSLAVQIAERAGLKLSDADRAWLNERQVRDLDNLVAMGRPTLHQGAHHNARIAAMCEREPDSLMVRFEWARCDESQKMPTYEEALRAAHKRFPRETLFLEALFQHAINTGQPQKAKEVLAEHVKLYPGSWEGLYLQSRYAPILGDGYETGLRAAESLAVLYPDCWMSWGVCAEAALTLAFSERAGHFFGEMNPSQQKVFTRSIEKALAAGERALTLNDKDVDLWTEMIEIYSENCAPRKAHQAFERAIALDPGHIEAYYNLAYMYMPGYQNDERKMKDILRRSLDAPAKTWRDIKTQAENALNLKDTKRGLALFEKAVAAAGDERCPGLHASYAQALDEFTKRREEALKHARLAVEQQPCPDTLLVLAQLLVKVDRLDEALAVAQRAKELDARDPDCDAVLAGVRYAMGQTQQAFKDLQRAHEREPRSVLYLTLMADAYIEQGEYDKAWQACQELLRNPEARENPDATRVLGAVHALKGRYRDAIRYYDMTLKKQPDDWDSLTHGALCYMALREHKRAAPRWQRALAKRGDDAEAHMGLAVCLSEMGQKQKGAAEARRAVKLNPDSANPQWLTKERHWPEKLARLAAQVAGSAAHE
jgi:tetratricopeptide (TPR) repeat protein